MNSRVSVWSGTASYDDPAGIVRLVREAVTALDLPSDFIRPGDHVVLKPNWIKEHDERHPGPGKWEHVITHPAVVEAVACWAAEEMAGEGAITICDAPQTDSSFSQIVRYTRIADVVARSRDRFPRVNFSILDLRQEEWHTVDGVTVAKRKLPGDPRGSTHVRLGSASEFVGFAGEGRLFGASYDMAETNARHHGMNHEYLLCGTPMWADVLINLPKLKTHKKVGITCALKNLVGINANKNWLPHHTEGSPGDGGDQFPEATKKARLERQLMGAAKRLLKDRPLLSRFFVPLKGIGRMYFGDTQYVVRSGNWHGNDTCWRMVLDLNKCLFFFDGHGQPRTEPRRYLAVADGIVGGEGNGPMAPDPKPCGVILASTHPVALDSVAATLMGFDWRKIPLLLHSFSPSQLSLTDFEPADISVVSNCEAWSGSLESMQDVFDFRPHFGWIGSIERDRASCMP